MAERIYLFRSPDFAAETGVAVAADGRPWGADVAAAVAAALVRAGFGVAAPRASENGWMVRAVAAAGGGGGTFAIFVQRAPVRAAPGAAARDCWVVQVGQERPWWGGAEADPGPVCAAIGAGLAAARVSDARWVDAAGFSALI
jgi:hypothetical protein